MALTEAKLRGLKPGPKPQKFSDAFGLHLLVSPNGSKLWRFAYRYGGVQKLLALGPYPLVKLTDARKLRDEARMQIADGVDPAQLRKAEKRRRKVAPGETFAEVAAEWFELNSPRWVDTYSTRLKSRMDADLIPKLGRRRLADIEALEVLDAIRAIERRGATEMARRVLQMASGIFRYGVATGRCARDLTTDLRGALRAQAPVKHRKALPAGELPEFLAALDAYYGDPVTKLALRLVLLTFVRTSEVRFAQWSEFEGLAGEAPLWRIPAERMKMRRPHLVPLAPQAVEVLRELRRHSGRSAFVVPAATRDGVISENTMIFALYRMGFHGRATVHGFRSTASTVLNEAEFNRDWIEMQLAHADGSVRSIYNAAEWLSGRRAMMLWWANYLDWAAGAGRAGRPSAALPDPFNPGLAFNPRPRSTWSLPAPDAVETPKVDGAELGGVRGQG